MKLSVIRDDGTVFVDGEAHIVDCTEVAEYIHAIQWDGQRGHIEFKPDRKGNVVPNVPIAGIEPYMYLVERWEARRDQVEKEKKAREEKRIAQDALLAKLKANQTLTPVQRKLATEEGDGVAANKSIP